jgi:enoyl-CoA hydratase/carnithine racemase
MIASKSPTALRIGKAAVYRQAGMNLPEAYGDASRAMVENMLDADSEEGISAFFERRQPNWRDA